MYSRWFYIWALLYKISFEIVYILYTSPTFSYMGVVFDYKISYAFLSYAIFFCMLLLLPRNSNRPSHQLAHLLMYTTVVPLLSIFWMAGKSIAYTLSASLCFAFIFIVIRYIKPIPIPLWKRKINLSIRLIHFTFACTIGVLILFTYKYGGIDNRAFDFRAIYQLRAETQYSGIWGYLLNWLAKLLIPFCIVIYMIEKRKLLFIISCCMQIYLYLCTGQKTILFSVVLIVITTYLLTRKIWSYGLPIMYSLIVLGSALYFKLTDNIMLIALSTVRQLGLPALISYKYYDFFSTNEKLHFSEGLIGTIFGVKSPYDIRAAYIISGDPANYENTGFMADAYANGGIIAMMAIALLFACILKFIDSISKNSPKQYKYTALLVYPVIVLNDGALLTTLFTGGLGLLLVFLYIVASEERRQMKTNEEPSQTNPQAYRLLGESN